MPIHEYFCLECQTYDLRPAGLDDDTAVCICGCSMIRTSDPFAPIEHGDRQVDGLFREFGEGLRAGREKLNG